MVDSVCVRGVAECVCTGCSSLNASMMCTRSSTFNATPDRPDDAVGMVGIEGGGGRRRGIRGVLVIAVKVEVAFLWVY